MSNRIKAIVRLIVSVLTIANMVLTAKGCNPIPFDENALTEVLTYLAAGAMTLWTWWKDAPMTRLANKHHDEMVLEKQNINGIVGEDFFDIVEEVIGDA